MPCHAGCLQGPLRRRGGGMAGGSQAASSVCTNPLYDGAAPEVVRRGAASLRSLQCAAGAS